MSGAERMKPEKPKFESDEDLTEVVTGHGPCTYLLLALLLLILLFPYAKGDALGRIVLAILYSLILIGGAFAISRDRRMFILGVGLAILGVALQWTALVTSEPVILRLAGLTYVAFLLLTLVNDLQYLL